MTLQQALCTSVVLSLGWGMSCKGKDAGSSGSGVGRLVGQVVAGTEAAPVPGASVTIRGGASATTDGNGVFVLERVPASREVFLDVRGPSYAQSREVYGSTTLRVSVRSDSESPVIASILRGCSVNVESSSRTTLGSNGCGSGGLSYVTLPKDGVVLKSGGPFSGTVRVEMVPLNPGKADDFMAIPRGSDRERQILGAVEVRLFDAASGAELQIAPGQSATVRVQLGSFAQTVPANELLGVWFDHARASWVDIGPGNVIIDGSLTFFELQMPHFTHVGVAHEAVAVYSSLPDEARCIYVDPSFQFNVEGVGNRAVRDLQVWLLDDYGRNTQRLSGSALDSGCISVLVPSSYPLGLGNFTILVQYFGFFGQRFERRLPLAARYNNNSQPTLPACGSTCFDPLSNYPPVTSFTLAARYNARSCIRGGVARWRGGAWRAAQNERVQLVDLGTTDTDGRPRPQVLAGADTDANGSVCIDVPTNVSTPITTFQLLLPHRAYFNQPISAPVDGNARCADNNGANCLDIGTIGERCTLGSVCIDADVSVTFGVYDAATASRNLTLQANVSVTGTDPPTQYSWRLIPQDRSRSERAATSAEATQVFQRAQVGTYTIEMVATLPARRTIVGPSNLLQWSDGRPYEARVVKTIQFDGQGASEIDPPVVQISSPPPTDGGASDGGVPGDAGTGDGSDGGTSSAPGMSFFVTRDLYNGGDGVGLNSDLAAADTFCQAQVNLNTALPAAVRNRTWRAYLSNVYFDANNNRVVVNARSRIGTGPWLNYNGEQVAGSVDALHARIGQLSAGPGVSQRLMQYGEQFTTGQQPVLTGSDIDGNQTDGICAGISRAAPSFMNPPIQLGNLTIQGTLDGASWNTGVPYYGCYGIFARLYCFATD